MEKFKGTPGPWVAHDDEESMATSVIISDSLDIIAVVGTYMTSTEEDYANASLIAAAPELLEALQKMVSKAYKQNWNDAYPEEIQSAQAAINKALGE